MLGVLDSMFPVFPPITNEIKSMTWAPKIIAKWEVNIKFIHQLWYIPAPKPQSFLSLALENSESNEGYTWDF